jgi:hypothetical protein
MATPKFIEDRQAWVKLAADEFSMPNTDASRLSQISRLLHKLDMVGMNDRELTSDEKAQEQTLMIEVKEICDRYNIPASDGNSIGYEFPDPRSGSGLRFILPSGKNNSLGGYNL